MKAKVVKCESCGRKYNALTASVCPRCGKAYKTPKKARKAPRRAARASKSDKIGGCVACGGMGQNSKGFPCVPCKGSGEKQACYICESIDVKDPTALDEFEVLGLDDKLQCPKCQRRFDNPMKGKTRR